MNVQEISYCKFVEGQKYHEYQEYVQLYKLTIYRDGFYSRTTAKYLRTWLIDHISPEAVPAVLKAAKEAINAGAEKWEVE